MALTDENGGMNTTMLVSPAGNMGGYPYPVYTGGGQGNGTGNQATSQGTPAPTGSNEGGFTGFEPFGGGSFFDEN